MRTSPTVFTVKAGALAIAVHKYEDGRYGFEWTPPGKERVRVRRRDRQSAIDEARKLVNATGAGKLDLLAIDPAEFAEFLAWKASRRKPSSTPDLVEKFLASKRSKGRTAVTIREIEGVAVPFAKHFAKPLADLTREEVEAWIDAKNVGPRRWNNILAQIIAIYRFARRDGCLPAEPHPVELIERRKVTVTIEIYTPAQLMTILEAAPMEWRPAVVLGAFCGLRPEEVAPDPRNSNKPRLCWESILWHRGKVDVPAAVSKVGQRRFAPLTDAAKAFLAPWRDAVGGISPPKRMRMELWNLPFPWINDGLRHSFASYRLPIIKDIGALALEMGNSPGMIRKHYLELQHDAEAEEWFGLRPSALFGTQKPAKPLKA